ncbi:hypothetical protein [Taibaiella helva]|uniref:hypothetical protein n=1 Tax=Taibaiella helva TaxID=2301235 RepID=UPI000E58ABE8|nr:hypothetical protein [Taibaiella helva]
MADQLNFEIDALDAFAPIWNKALTIADCEQRDYEDFLLYERHPISQSAFEKMILFRFKGVATAIQQIQFKRITRGEIEAQIMFEGRYKPCNEYVVEVDDQIEITDPADNTKITFTAVQQASAPANQHYFSLSLFKAIFREYPTVSEFFFSIGKSTNPFTTWQEVILFKFMLPTGQTAYYNYSQDPPTKHLIKALLEYLSQE